MSPSQVERAEDPRVVNGRPEGMLEHELATDFHALVCVKGFEEARQIMAEIINYEADRRPSNGHA